MGLNKKRKRKIHQPLEKKLLERISELEEMNKNLSRLIQRSLFNEMLKDINTDHLKKIKIKGLLSICSNCKKIKDKKGYWAFIEHYIESHSDVQFTYGICPDCSDKLYGNDDWYIAFKKRIN